MQRLQPAVLEGVLNKRRWGQFLDNMNAIVSAEIKRARRRFAYARDNDLEYFFSHNDPSGLQVDEDCRNFIRAEPPMIRAAVVWRGWPRTERNPSAKLMNRTNSYRDSFYGPSGAFDPDRIEARCPGFLADLRSLLHRRYGEPDPEETYQDMLTIVDPTD